MQQPKTDQKEQRRETELGLLPQSWEVIKLQDATISMIGGGTPSTNKPEYWDGEILWLTSACITGLYIDRGQKNITKLGLENSSTHLIPKGNLIIGTRVGVGKVAINLVDIAISQDLTGAIIDQKKFHTEFLAYYLLSTEPQKIFSLQTRGTTIKGIPREDLSKILVCKPFLSEQQKIAQVLSTLQTAQEKTEQVVNVLKEFKKSLMKHLLTCGPVSLKDVKKVKLKKTEIGMIPECWVSLKLSDIFTEINLKVKDTNLDKKKIPVLSMTRYDGLISQDKKFYKRVASIDISNYKIIKKNQLAYGFPMDEGVIYFLKNFEIGAISPAYFTWQIIIDKVDVNFLDILLKSRALIEKYKSLYSTTVQRRRIVSKSDFKNIEIYLPSFEEQQKISSILLSVDEKIEKEKTKKKSLEDLFKSMLHNLMTAKVRVNNLVMSNDK